MYKYFLNKDTSKNPNHDHEVHKEGCVWMPLPQNRVDLGYFNNGVEAVREGIRRGYKKVDGCRTCCPEAHHG